MGELKSAWYLSTPDASTVAGVAADEVEGSRPLIVYKEEALEEMSREGEKESAHEAFHHHSIRTTADRPYIYLVW